MNLRKLQTQKHKIEKIYNLKDMNVLLTGKIPKYTRAVIEKKIIELGGILDTKPHNSTNIVVYTRINTNKYKTAKVICFTFGLTDTMTFVTGESFVTNYLKLK